MRKSNLECNGGDEKEGKRKTTCDSNFMFSIGRKRKEKKDKQLLQKQKENGGERNVEELTETFTSENKAYY